MVTISCYGKLEQLEREDAIAKYTEAVAATEGSERDRYMDILMDIYEGKDFCSDRG